MWASYQQFLFCGYWDGGTPVMGILADLIHDNDIPFLWA
jgi:hypothetical protein